MGLWDRVQRWWRGPRAGPARRTHPLLSRFTSDWWVTPTSPTADLRASLALLRHRARDLERSNPLVRRYLDLLADQVIGTGIRLQMQRTYSDGRPDTRANTLVEEAWDRWGGLETCTIDQRWTWSDVQRLAIRLCARDGEVFLRLIEGATPYGFALQVIDPDLVDETLFRAPRAGQPEIRMGIEIDGWGRPLAYHVRCGYPTDLFGGGDGNPSETVRVPAAEMVHLMLARRAGAVRAASWLEPVMLLLRHLDGYTEAEIVAARTAAAKMGFILPGPDAIVPHPDEADQATSSALVAEPGVIDRLAPGETFAPWDPDHPTGNYERFVVQIAKLIAAGLNVSYASLTGDLRETNYSSARVGLTHERDSWRSLQRWFTVHCCDRVFRRWLDVAWLRGHLGAIRYPPAARDARWQARGWQGVDPGRDVQANALAVAHGFASPQMIVGEDGRDYEEVLREIAASRRLASDLGVPLAWPQGVMPAGSPAGTPATDPIAEEEDTARAIRIVG